MKDDTCAQLCKSSKLQRVSGSEEYDYIVAVLGIMGNGNDWPAHSNYKYGIL